MSGDPRDWPSDVIGMVSFDVGGVAHVATLNTARKWKVTPKLPGDIMGKVIRIKLAEIVQGYAGPQDGPFGPKQLSDAATFLRGAATIREIPEGPPDTVY